MKIEDTTVIEQDNTTVYEAPQIEEVLSAEDIQREVTNVAAISTT